MTDRETVYRNPANASLRLRIAGALAAIGLASLFISWRFQTTPYLISAASSSRPQRYVRMWFDSSDRLVGAFWQGRRLVLERPASPDKPLHFEIGEADDVRWTVSADLTRLAWISGATLHIAPLEEGAKHLSIALPASQKPVALTIPSDGSTAVLLADSTIRRWDASGKPLGEWRVPLSAIDRAAADGNDIGIYTSKDDRLTLFNFHQGQWVQVEAVLAPERPDEIIFPGPGVAGAIAGGHLRIDGHPRPGPDAIGSASMHLYDAIVAGAFEGVFVAPREDDPYLLAPSTPDSIVAAGQKQLAVSGVNGTALFDLSIGSHLSSNGRKLSYIGIACFLGALLLAIGPALLNAFLLAYKTVTRKGPRRVRIASTLDRVPPQLVEIIHSGDAILWAGAGLSAQAGFPTREDFIATLLRTAQIEQWLEGPLISKLIGLCSRGQSEAALTELVAAMRSDRGALLSHFTATYSRFAAPSRSHELLERLNFGFAVTTNYDILLERLIDSWGNGLTTLKSGKLAPNGLTKIYGALQSLSTVVACQAELRDVMAKSPCLPGLRELFKEKPAIFLGCSARGLLYDLHALAIPAKSTRCRYAVIGVSGSSWQRDVKELSDKFGIEVLLCSEDQISHGLPAFLDRLVREVGKLRREAMSEAAAAG